MTSVLIKQVTIADPRSPWNAQQVDILVHEGKIIDISPLIEAPAGIETVALPGVYAAPGFTDIFAHFNDPGFEFKETTETGAAAAAMGGYCRVLILPNTQPPLHSKAQIEYITQKNRNLPVEVLPLGAITKNCEGKDLAEMYDMRQSGAVAFTDGIHPVQNSQVMLKALQYVKSFDGVVVQVPDELSLSKHGLMHEGLVSTRLGLPGKPALAESLLLARDIELLRYTGSKLHVTGISTAAAVDLIKQAKSEGLQITCSVTPYHLSFTDDDLNSYDTNLKVNPPLRSAADVEALKQALLDGVIDCIASHHQPHEWDSKVCEFEYAKYGMEGLESCVGAVGAALPDISAERIAEIFAIRPATIFDLPLPVINIGEHAMMSLFDGTQQWQMEAKQLKSRSVNNAFLGKPLVGRPLGIVRENYHSIHT